MIYFLTKVIMFPFSVVYGLIIIIRNKLFDFGVFKSKYMISRYGSDPRNKKKIYIPPKWKVTFKASADIKKKLNEKT